MPPRCSPFGAYSPFSGPALPQSKRGKWVTGAIITIGAVIVILILIFQDHIDGRSNNSTVTTTPIPVVASSLPHHSSANRRKRMILQTKTTCEQHNQANVLLFCVPISQKSATLVIPFKSLVNDRMRTTDGEAENGSLYPRVDMWYATIGDGTNLWGDLIAETNGYDWSSYSKGEAVKVRKEVQLQRLPSQFTLIYTPRNSSAHCMDFTLVPCIYSGKPRAHSNPRFSVRVCFQNSSQASTPAKTIAAGASLYPFLTLLIRPRPLMCGSRRTLV